MRVTKRVRNVELEQTGAFICPVDKPVPQIEKATRKFTSAHTLTLEQGDFLANY